MKLSMIGAMIAAVMVPDTTPMPAPLIGISPRPQLPNLQVCAAAASDENKMACRYGARLILAPPEGLPIN